MLKLFTSILLVFIGIALQLQATYFTHKCPEACKEIGQFKTLKKGVLTVGTYLVNPPFEYAENGKMTGFEIELIRAICKRLNLQCRIIDTTWEGMIKRLENNVYDVIIGGITITEARKNRISFSDPYMTTTISLIVNPEINPEIQSMDNLKGRSVVVQEDTTDYTVVEQMLKKKEIGQAKAYPFNQIEEMIISVQKGQSDAMLKVQPVAEFIVNHMSHLKIVGQVPNDPQPLGLAFNKENPELQKAVNWVLKKMKEDCSFEVLYHKWFVK